MKRLLLPLLLVLLALPAWAQGSLTFTTYKGEPFLMKLNGRTVTRAATNFVRIDNLRPGRHLVEVKIMGRYGVYSMGTKVYVNNGYESNYEVLTKGRSGKVWVRLVDEVPLPRVVVPYPRPHYPDHHNNYDRHDRYDNDCRNLMGKYDLDRLIESMRSRDFESTRLTIAREALRNNSILSEDLRRLLEQFDYESTRVEFAKFAYDYVCDKERFYYIYDIFKFDSSVRELEEYTSRRRPY
ncbi:DUF4476 domain-containing protein [Pontibacter ruber]|uniref:DUF4476 domain-containing protein n=1 Tax=Pontibacter ruber TaxID=1343895 RepID=A0ABW5CZ84_9BACT|nr:DUF4476 domain-containing protein [Pontibacter ruber]